jgi:pimeloyl-ACP methyl ester carboxylesterase
MDVILVPGFWLDGASWQAVLPPLERAGHTLHPLTLPGKQSPDAARAGIGLRDHVDAVLAEVDRLPGPVALVGHSGGGAIIHAVVDARPDRIARAVYVDSGPLGAGAAINDSLPVVDGEIPLPDWGVFADEDLVDLDDDLRARFREIALPEPKGVAYDAQVLSDARARYAVPVTVITSEMPSALLRELIAEGHPYVAELGLIEDYEIIDLPTGHWPQLTRPVELGETIAEALRVR